MIPALCVFMGGSKGKWKLTSFQTCKTQIRIPRSFTFPFTTAACRIDLKTSEHDRYTMPSKIKIKMPTLRKRKTQALEPEPNRNPETNNDQNPKISLYEQSREARIKENLERMQKLGLKELSLRLNSSLHPPKHIRRDNTPSTKQPSPFLPSAPTRRSSRLQNVTPVSYCETAQAKKGGPLEDEDVKLQEGPKPEVYTEEHEKLLGSTERSWTLFVDGYGKDGKRIYDQVNGKTCHQCRQKTLGYRTHCTKCQIVQGQFCGDCLYMRYGEHVLEAIENPNWICPVCRGICNCSLCRNAKGWAPTGALYRKISSLGYKSVAQYLIQTRSLQNNKGNHSVPVNQVSAKRTLHFPDMDALSKESPEVSASQVGQLMPQSINKMHDEFKVEEIKQMQSSGHSAPDKEDKRSFAISSTEAQPEVMESAEVICGVHDNVEKKLKPNFEDMRENVYKCEEQKEFPSRNKEHYDNNIKLESCSELEGEKQRSAIKLNPDSIAARSRQRYREGNGQDGVELTQLNGKISGDDLELTEVNERISDIKQAVKNLLSNQELVEDKEKNESYSDLKRVINNISANKAVEKEKERHAEDNKHADSFVALESSAMLKKKPARATEPSPDSIGGRLRQRRRMGNGHGDMVLTGTNEQTSDVQLEVEDNMKPTSTMKTSEDGIARRLRPRHKTS